MPQADVPDERTTFVAIERQRKQTHAQHASIYETISRGGLALVPTDVGYGLVAMEGAAVQRVYQLKGRPLSKPCVTVVNAEIFDDLVVPLEPRVREWIATAALRTPLAVVARLDDHSRLLRSLSDAVRRQATQNGTIATFHSAGPLVEAVAALAQSHGRLVVGSSANVAGTGNKASFADVPEAMRKSADLVLDHGPVWYENEHQHATTILDLSTGTFLRKGINFTQIERSWRTHRERTGRAA